MPLWVIGCLVGVFIGASLICFAACTVSSHISEDEYDVEHEIGLNR